MAPVLEIMADDELRTAIINGYTGDSWCKKALDMKMDGLVKTGDLLYYKGRLVIPRTGNICKTLVGLVHNTLGHFGFDKTYEVMHDAFYWPGMRTFLETSYIPGCEECQ